VGRSRRTFSLQGGDIFTGYVLVAVYLFIYLYNSKSIKPNRMKFGGMIGYYLGTICLDFGIDRVKGQGHGKVNIFFLP